MSFASLASSVVQSLRSSLGVPSIKVPIDSTAFISYVLPLFVCYLIEAVLVIMPRTRIVRLAIWPVVASLALRAALSVDMSHGQPSQAAHNVSFAEFLFCVISRTLDWALVKEPLVRRSRPANSSPSIITDALDLAANGRGLGWDWSRGLYIPRETRPANRTGFIFCTFASAVVHALICSILHRALLTLVPTRTESFPQGSTIFDETLPFPVRYLRASIVSTLTCLAIYAVVQASYDLMTIPAVLVLRQDPAQWSPVFDAPWRATSLSDFWGRRWHQLVRRTFLFLGGYPLSLVLGRSGVVIGSFLASAALHHVGLMALDSQIEIWWMLAGFGMMAPGIIAERAFSRLTGKKVGGVSGWLWTMTWLILWGNVMVEGFARAGMFGCVGSTSNMLPKWTWVKHLATDFDALLHVNRQGTATPLTVFDSVVA